MKAKNICLVLLSLSLYSCDRIEEKEQPIKFNEFKVSKELKANPMDYLLTVKDFIYDSIYESRNYSDFQSLKIQSDSSLPLKMVYRFKVSDSLNNLSMVIGSIINIDNTPEEAKFSLKLYESGFIGGLEAKNRDLTIIKLDSLVKFGDYSAFVGYQKDEDIMAYYFISRIDKLVILSSFHSNHTHLDYIPYLKRKLAAIKKELLTE